MKSPWLVSSNTYLHECLPLLCEQWVEGGAADDIVLILVIPDAWAFMMLFLLCLPRQLAENEDYKKQSFTLKRKPMSCPGSVVKKKK